MRDLRTPTLPAGRTTRYDSSMARHVSESRTEGSETLAERQQRLVESIHFYRRQASEYALLGHYTKARTAMDRAVTFEMTLAGITPQATPEEGG